MTARTSGRPRAIGADAVAQSQGVLARACVRTARPPRPSSEQAEAQFKVAGQAQGSGRDWLPQRAVTTNLELSDRRDAQRFFAQSTVAQLRAALNLRRAEVAAAEGRLYRCWSRA